MIAGNMVQGTLVTFSAKCMHRLKFNQGEFSSQYSAKNPMVEPTGESIHRVPTSHSTLIAFSTKIIC
jgi:hypothetical protein